MFISGYVLTSVTLDYGFDGTVTMAYRSDIFGNPDDWRMQKDESTGFNVMKSASIFSILSIIDSAFSSVIAIQAVAYASASMVLGAIIVTDRMSVCAGCPSVGFIVCHIRPDDVVLKLR